MDDRLKPGNGTSSRIANRERAQASRRTPTRDRSGWVRSPTEPPNGPRIPDRPPARARARHQSPTQGQTPDWLSVPDSKLSTRIRLQVRLRTRAPESDSGSYSELTSPSRSECDVMRHPDRACHRPGWLKFRPTIRTGLELITSPRLEIRRYDPHQTELTTETSNSPPVPDSRSDATTHTRPD